MPSSLHPIHFALPQGGWRKKGGWEGRGQWQLLTVGEQKWLRKRSEDEAVLQCASKGTLASTGDRDRLLSTYIHGEVSGETADSPFVWSMIPKSYFDKHDLTTPYSLFFLDAITVTFVCVILLLRYLFFIWISPFKTKNERLRDTLHAKSFPKCLYVKKLSHLSGHYRWTSQKM